MAKRKDVDVRRLFTDQSEVMHRKSDLFGISLSWELDGPVLLELLEKQRIPIWNNQRTNKDPIVFGGGPVLTANPEPFAPFLDVVLLGDGEELIPEFINKVSETRDLCRLERLKELAQIPGIYIPCLYKAIYSNDGQLISVKPIESGIPFTIKKQTWKGNNLSYSSVITPESVWPNIHMVEMVRSCPELCRFCLASYLTLPFRTASINEGLIPAVEKGLTATKRIGLLGASVTQHPQFYEFLTWLSQDRFEDLRISISSVRASTVNSKMTRILSKRGSNSITIAIESGSERIRAFINKKLSEEEILSAAKYAQEGGLKGMKLYGMVGLPTEEEEDINSTANLLIKLKENTSQLRLKLGVSTFVPKAHTPFQWYGVRPEAKKRLKQLAKQLRPEGIELHPESYGWSIIQALISRSDRRIAPVIASLKGSKNTLGNWKKSYNNIRENKSTFESANLPSWDSVIHQDWDLNTVLPWSHLDSPIKNELLIQHLKESQSHLSTEKG